MRTREIIIVIILLSIALIRFLYFIPTPPSGYFDSVGKVVSFHGIVVDQPDVRVNNQRLTVNPINTDINILVVANLETKVEYGDEIYVKGSLETPENFITNTGKEFNYERYLANRDVYFTVQYAEVDVVSHDQGSMIKKYLFKLKNNFVENINLAIGHPSSDLANGLILGVKGNFSEKMRNDFVTTGTIHIIALSGYNVTIVANSVVKVFGIIFSMAISLGLGVFVIILFVVMAGSGASAVRAGVMAIIALLGRISGRNYDASRALIIAGLIMFAYDPRVVTDISFQLSFVATFGILYITPMVVSWVFLIPARFGIREIASTTIAAQIAVLPLLLYSSGILSFVSFPANIFILPFIPLAMLFSFISGLAGFLGIGLSSLFGGVSNILLSYILKVIQIFASLPFASVTVYKFSLLMLVIFYLLILFWVFKRGK
ncbi:MAG: ComEC/Rec2 family competence protein [Candidatus Paceibacterota bacterium]